MDDATWRDMADAIGPLGMFFLLMVGGGFVLMIVLGVVGDVFQAIDRWYLKKRKGRSAPKGNDDGPNHGQ